MKRYNLKIHILNELNSQIFKIKKIILTLSLITFIGLSTTKAQVGIGTNTPNASSILELQSTDKGFLPPQMENRSSNAPEGFTIYNTSIKC